MSFPNVQEIHTNKSNTRRGVLPQGVCLHYTASGRGALRPKIARWAADTRESSTDFVVARNPKQEPTIQLTTDSQPEAFRRYTWHCGGSRWHGFRPETPGLLRAAGFSRASAAAPEALTNLLLIGVDLDNYGPLHKRGGEVFYRPNSNRPDAALTPWRGPVFYDPDGNPWEEYTTAQIEALCFLLYDVSEACPQIRKLAEIGPEDTGRRPLPTDSFLVGHETIRGTKTDPGAAFVPFWGAARAALAGHLPNLREV